MLRIKPAAEDNSSSEDEKVRKNRNSDNCISLPCLGCSYRDVGIDTNSWIFDSGASVHVTPKRDEINNFILSKNQSFVLLPDGSKLPIVGTGSVTLNVLVNDKQSSLLEQVQ